MLEKIVDGYGFALKDFEAVEKTGKTYIKDHVEELGGERYVYHPLTQLGAILAWINHPIRGYHTLKKVLSK